MPEWLATRRWFGGKARKVQSVRITDYVPLGGQRSRAPYSMLLARLAYVEGEPETYQIPVGLAFGEDAERIAFEHPAAVIARIPVQGSDAHATLYDAPYDSRFNSFLLDAIGRRRRIQGSSGELIATPTKSFRSLRGAASDEVVPRLMGVEQSNSSIVYGDRLILKLFRRPDKGVNPDLEIGRFLTARTQFENIAQVAGAIEYGGRKGEPMSLGILHSHVSNEGDAWEYTLDALSAYLERALSEMGEADPAAFAPPELAFRPGRRRDTRAGK